MALAPVPTLLAALAALGLAAPAAAQGVRPFTLSPGDTIAISVLEDPGLNRQVLVPPDGRISIPLAGAIDVAGRGLQTVEALIRQRLSDDFIEPPTVTVSLAGLADPEDEIAAAPRRVYVIGEVANPGAYDVEEPLDALQALALAGGPGVFAARDRIQIRRRADGADAVFFFDYEALEAGAVPTSSIALEDGDVIVVPERGLFD